ncbi:MAG: trehalose-phosphatase [Chloroflexi bacterium]|nr:trehalose-phosphatase [Chloroflexota bacterium]
MMIGSEVLANTRRQLRAGRHLVLFLDYDGTLVPIARTPDEARPDGTLLTLLNDLTHVSAIHTIILSGRPLSSLQAMLPIPGLILAGTYGMEVQWGGKLMTRGVTPAQIRPVIAQVKAEWERLTDKRNGFLLEDKGLAVALHARWADPAEADVVLNTARVAATQTVSADNFRILGGDRFLEVAPAAAHKGHTVEWLLDQIHAAGALLVYFGDDDKDEEAFAVIRQGGGIAVGVGQRYELAQADARIASPEIVRDWLRRFYDDVCQINSNVERFRIVR